MPEDTTNQVKYFLSKYSKVLLLLFLLILISIPMIEMMYLLGIKGLFGYFTGMIIGTTGANQYLAKAIVLVLMIPLLWSFKWTFSFSPQKRRTGYSILAGYMILFYASMFFLTKDQKFDFSTGKATKYYANTPEGKRYFDAPGFDPKYGIPLKPVDPNIARSDAFNTRPPQKLEDPKQFFDVATSEPVVWYYENADGKLEFFDQPGFHPKYGDELKPVTPQIVQKNERQAMLKRDEEAKRTEASQKRQEEERKRTEVERKNIEEAERKRVEDQRNYDQKRWEEEKKRVENEAMKVEQAERKRVEDQRNYDQKKREEEKKRVENEAMKVEQARQAAILQKEKEVRQYEEARQAKLDRDLRSFQGLINKAETSSRWLPSSSIVNYVKGKRILVLLSSYTQEQGAEIIVRLKSMGAIVNYSLYSDTATSCPKYEICYSPRYLETTQAIQGSLSELCQFRITSSSTFGDTIIVGVGG